MWAARNCPASIAFMALRPRVPSCTANATGPSSAQRIAVMLYWALLFLIVAIVAGALGFGGVASTATGIAKVLFVIFLIVFLVMTVANFVT